MLSFAIEKIVDQLRVGTFELDCLEMAIQQRDSDRAPIIKGSGQISIRADGVLGFKLYADGGLPRRLRLQAGDLVPHSQMYRLRATDLEGREWCCQFVSPDETGTRNGRSLLVGAIWELEHSLERGGVPADYLELYVLGDVKVPTNAYTETKTKAPDGESTSSLLDCAVFEGTHCRFDFRQAGGLLKIGVTGNQLPEHADLRVVEAMQFMLASPMRWSLLHREGRKGQTIRIRLRPPEATGVRMRQPIQFLGSRDLTGNMWPLFERYYEFASAEPSENWHPVSVHLYNACQASAASIDTQRLALGVAVEGIAAVAFPQATTALPEEALKSVTDHLRAWTGLPDWEQRDSFLERLNGLFGLLRKTSARDRLRWLAVRGVVTNDDIKAWTKLRNSAAHPERPDAGVTQEALALIEHVTTVMYKLVFAAIGYKGAYTDYSIRGWPTCQFAAPNPPCD